MPPLVGELEEQCAARGVLGVLGGAGAVVGVLSTTGRSTADQNNATLLSFADPSGVVATWNVNGALDLTNPFFQELGINGRTCFSCHRPEQGWTITPRSVQLRFE